MSLRSHATRVDRYFCNRAMRRNLRTPMPANSNVRTLDLPDAWIRAYVAGAGPDFLMLPDPQTQSSIMLS